MTLMPTNNANPYGMPSILDTPEMRRQSFFDMLGGMGMGLIQAGAPSPYPQSPFGAFGLAMQGAQQATNEDKYLKRAMVNMQAQKLRQDMENDKAWADAFKAPAGASAGVPSGPQEAAAPPQMQPGGGVNPNNVGNVRYADGRPGFQQPASFDDGVRLTVNNVQSYPGAYNGGQPMSLWDPSINGEVARSGFIKLQKSKGDMSVLSPQEQAEVAKAQRTVAGRWAPYGDGANDPAAWANNVAKIGNLPVDQPLDFRNPQIAAMFARGTHGAEHGGQAVQPVEAYMPGATSGRPVQLAQNGNAPTLPPQQAYRPQTMGDVIQSMPPGVRQMVGAMGRKEGMGVVMKYADPGSEAVYDTQSGAVVFIPKTQVGRDPRFQPVEGQKLQLELRKEQRDIDKDARDAANQKVVIDPKTGQPTANTTLQGYEVGVEAGKKGLDQTEKQFQQEQQLRNAYESQPAVKSYRVVVPMLEAAKDAVSRPTRAADLNLVYAFAKLMDPDSVVRESETGAVNATASVADRLSGYINQLNGNAMLSPETRAKLMDELNSRFVSIKESNDVLAKSYSDIAKAYGLAPERIAIPIRAPGSEGGGNGGPAKPPGQTFNYVPGKGLVAQ
jgi:hypothetical protein